MPHRPTAKQDARLELGRRAYAIFAAQFAALREITLRVDAQDDGTFAVRGTWLERDGSSSLVLAAGTVLDDLSQVAAQTLMDDIERAR